MHKPLLKFIILYILYITHLIKFIYIYYTIIGYLFKQQLYYN